MVGVRVGTQTERAEWGTVSVSRDERLLRRESRRVTRLERGEGSFPQRSGIDWHRLAFDERVSVALRGGIQSVRAGGVHEGGLHDMPILVSLAPRDGRCDGVSRVGGGRPDLFRHHPALGTKVADS